MKQVLMPISSNKDILLSVENLSTGYGEQQVLFDISFEVKRGEIVLLVGGNGSGKSTVLKAIYGLLNDYIDKKGIITFEGEDITEREPFQMIEKGLVYVPQKKNTFEQLTLMENLRLVAPNALGGEELKRRINDVFEKFPQLATLKNRTPFHLSGGEKQQLALGMALMLDPKMILLDEPSAGISPKAWQQYVETIESLNQRGLTFLIVEHRLNEIAKTAHNSLRMRLGKIIETKVHQA